MEGFKIPTHSDNIHATGSISVRLDSIRPEKPIRISLKPTNGPPGLLDPRMFGEFGFARITIYAIDWVSPFRKFYSNPRRLRDLLFFLLY